MSLIELSKQAKHTVFDLFSSSDFDINKEFEVFSSRFDISQKEGYDSLVNNFSSVWIKMIVMYIMTHMKDLQFLKNTIFNLIKTCYQKESWNFKLAVYFKKLYGRIQIPDKGDLINLQILHENCQDNAYQESYCETALPLLRKLHAIMCIVNKITREKLVKE